MYCWGRGVNGELGRDVLLDSTTPTAVNMNNFGTESVKQVVAGDKFTCASTVEGTAFCWGYNDKGRTGVGLATGKTQYPTAVKGLNGKKVESISAGDSHACAVISGGQEVYCWGKNFKGQLGNTAFGYRNIASKVPFGSTILLEERLLKIFTLAANLRV